MIVIRLAPMIQLFDQHPIRQRMLSNRRPLDVVPERLLPRLMQPAQWTRHFLPRLDFGVRTLRLSALCFNPSCRALWFALRFRILCFRHRPSFHPYGERTVAPAPKFLNQISAAGTEPRPSPRRGRHSKSPARQCRESDQQRTESRSDNTASRPLVIPNPASAGEGSAFPLTTSTTLTYAGTSDLSSRAQRNGTLLQLRVLRFRLLIDRNPRIRIFPQRKKFLVRRQSTHTPCIRIGAL